MDSLLPLKKVVFICFDESPLKMIKNAFYVMLKALYILEIFTFLSRLFGYVEKLLDDDVIDWTTNNYDI